MVLLQPSPPDMIPLMGMFTGMVSMVLIAFTVIKVAQSQVGQAHRPPHLRQGRSGRR